MYLTVRYDMPDEKGETRRERNARFDVEAPDVEVPLEASHVWEWFWDISGRRRSGPEALTFGDIASWISLLQLDVLPQEVAMLTAMDDQYLRAVREDQADRAKARQQQGSS